MKLGFKGTIHIQIIAVCCAIVLVSRAVAAHVTDYLDPLQSEVTNRLAMADTNRTPAQTRALSSANKVLNRNAKTEQAELVLLASAAKTLNARFAADFLAEENDALGSYSYDAHSRLSDIYSVIATNNVRPSVSNLLSQAASALAGGDATSNSVPVRARALAKSLTKLSVAEMQVIRLLGPAPVTLTNRFRVELAEDAIVNDQTIYFFDVPTGTYSAHNPEELGLWAYHRTGRSNGVITIMPNFPSNDVPRDFQLTFTSLSSGTFSGTNNAREHIQGMFKTSH